MRRRHFALSLAATAAAACSAGPERSDSRVPAPSRDEDLPSEVRGLGVGGASLTVIVEGARPSMSRDAYESWVRDSAQMIADYYGGTLPVPGIEITLVTSGRGSIGYGHHQDGRWIRIHCGARTSDRAIANDWVMVHEMLHATFPDLSSRHRWMQEGLSTYLEKIVRARAGALSEAQVWGKLTRMVHHGRPGRGDRGLDRTHTWGRTYWGGALFWMVADIELRAATNNATSLRDALLHIASVGGNGRQNWTTAAVVEACDTGTGTTIVSDLYARMALAPGDVDLDRLWTELGIGDPGSSSITFDDSAPLAHVRRGICSQRASIRRTTYP